MYAQRHLPFAVLLLRPLCGMVHPHPAECFYAVPPRLVGFVRSHDDSVHRNIHAVFLQNLLLDFTVHILSFQRATSSEARIRYVPDAASDDGQGREAVLECLGFPAPIPKVSMTGVDSDELG